MQLCVCEFLMQVRKEASKMPHSTSDRYLYGSSTQRQCYSDSEM